MNNLYAFWWEQKPIERGQEWWLKNTEENVIRLPMLLSLKCDNWTCSLYWAPFLVCIVDKIINIFYDTIYSHGNIISSSQQVKKKAAISAFCAALACIYICESVSSMRYSTWWYWNVFSLLLLCEKHIELKKALKV